MKRGYRVLCLQCDLNEEFDKAGSARNLYNTHFKENPTHQMVLQAIIVTYKTMEWTKP